MESAMETYGEDRLTAGDFEHLTVLTAGAAVTLFGLSKRGLGGLVLTGLGVGLFLRGTQGYRRFFNVLGWPMPDSHTTLSTRAVRVDTSIFVERPPDELYRFWRKLENLPVVMGHLVSVRQIRGNRSHWVAKAPAGTIVEWEADIINDVENEIIAWCSLEGSDVDNAGAVHFMPVDNGTEVSVTIRYSPPGDVLGAAVARLLGGNPRKQIEADLERFKLLMESGLVTLS